ncbi:MAG: dual specificity protein phosphatase family protein [Gemmataceae bacterium]
MRTVRDHPPLWVGHVGDVRDLRRVLSAGVGALVDLAMMEPPARVTRDLAYLRFPLLDGPDNPPWLLRAAVGAVAGLARDGVPTLVFCDAGMSRSPCVAAAGLARATGRTFDEVLREVLRGGPADVSPALLAAVRAVPL